MVKVIVLPVSAKKSLWTCEPGSVLFNVGTAPSILWRSWLTVGPASCFVYLGERLRFFPLLL
jgi:hypothetical protein